VTKQLEFLTGHCRESSVLPVYIVAIGWLYVVLMMTLTERSFIAGEATLLCYGVLPLGTLRTARVSGATMIQARWTCELGAVRQAC
jgi:hypothetical protein